jgi:hypothetical protein
MLLYELRGSGEKATRHQLKSKASEATVLLPSFVVERLRAHRDGVGAKRPDVRVDDGRVFVTPRGYAVNGSWLTKHFQALLEQVRRLRLPWSEDCAISARSGHLDPRRNAQR